jgi:hypothetical protein
MKLVAGSGSGKTGWVIVERKHLIDKTVAQEFDITIDKIQESLLKGPIEYRAGKNVLAIQIRTLN